MLENIYLNKHTHTHTHTHTQFNSLWSGTTRVGRYQKKHSPTHTHPGHQTSFINFLQLLCMLHSILFVQFTCLTVLFDHSTGPLWSSSWSRTLYFICDAFLHPVIIFFCSTCPNQCSLFCCNTNAMSSIPSLFLSSLLTT